MTRLLCFIAVWFVMTSKGLTTLASEWHVSPGGTPAGQGTVDSPWDIKSALEAEHKVAPGDMIWLHAGTYKHPAEIGGMGFRIKLAGRDGAPVQVRAHTGQRVTIDGGLRIEAPASYLWIWDLEILVSEPRPEKPVPPDPSYRNVNRPWGGLNVYGGTGCKFINLVIHDNSQGVSWWTGSKESELHGCLIYDNGWAGTDRGHGHAIYTQNNEGVKTITDCIFAGGYGYTMHAYGSSRADVNNYHVAGNIAYNAGTFLIGGGKPSHHIRVLTNFLYGLSMQLGYSAPYNEDCEVRGNVIVNGNLSINKFKQATEAGNLILKKDQARPPGALIVLRPNRYDQQRANLIVFNWDKKSEVTVDASAFLKPGDHYRLMNPSDFFGKPALAGVYPGHPITVPMTGEFAAFVVKKTD